MTVGRDGARLRITANIAVICLTLSGMLGISNASGDEGVEEAPVVVTAQATEESAAEVQGDKPTPDPDPKPDLKSGEDVVASDPVCRPEGGGTVAITTTSWTQDWVLADGQWVLGEKVFGQPVETTRPATAEECPAPEPEPSDTSTPTEEPADLPVAGDLLVQCAPGNRISLTHNREGWQATVIVGYVDANGVEVPLNAGDDVFAGSTEYVDIARVPSGTSVGYWTAWLELGDDSVGYVENGGTITCGEPASPTPDVVIVPVCEAGQKAVTITANQYVEIVAQEGTPDHWGLLEGKSVTIVANSAQATSLEIWFFFDDPNEGSSKKLIIVELDDCEQVPTPTPSASVTPTPVDPTPSEPATPAPTVDPTPTQTVKPTPTESAKPSPTKSADQKPTKASGQPSKSDPKKSSSTGVVDEPVGMSVGLAAAFGAAIIGYVAVIAVRRRLS